VSTNNDSFIKSVLVFALDGGLFEGESLMVYPPTPTGTGWLLVLRLVLAVVLMVVVGCAGRYYCLMDSLFRRHGPSATQGTT